MTTGCRFCDSRGATGQHLDILLPPFRTRNHARTSDARKADWHPLPLILYARAKVENGRNIDWNVPAYTAAQHRVYTTFAAYVIVPRVEAGNNPFYTRCTPGWWMAHVERITESYAADRDYEAMVLAVEEVLEVARRLMNDIEYRERAQLPVPAAPAQKIHIGQRIQGNTQSGDLNAMEVIANRGVATGRIGQGVKEESDDDDLYSLPPPPQRRRERRNDRAKVVETISLLSSSPVRPATPGAADPVVFTLTVNVIGMDVVVPVTMAMTLADTIRTTLTGSVLAGMEPTAFVLASPAGEVWGEEKWNSVWDMALTGAGGEQAVQLLAKKK